MKNQELEIFFKQKLVDTIDYVTGSVVMKVILKKKTGSITIVSFDSGEALPSKIFPFDNLIQIIDGEAEIIINEESNTIKNGHIIIIPAHTRNIIKAHKRFKMISIIIKSGYEDVSI